MPSTCLFSVLRHMREDFFRENFSQKKTELSLGLSLAEGGFRRQKVQGSVTLECKHCLWTINLMMNGGTWQLTFIVFRVLCTSLLQRVHKYSVEKRKPPCWTFFIHTTSSPPRSWLLAYLVPQKRVRIKEIWADQCELGGGFHPHWS